MASKLGSMDSDFPECFLTPEVPASSHAISFEQNEQRAMATARPEVVREMNARRKMYPKEQWLALKPIIQRLYVDEGQTFLKVAEFLNETRGFNPTKKQFLRKVKEWGFEKNVKSEERRRILESVEGDGQLEERFLRGRRLNKAKIERWRKREGMIVGSAEPGKLGRQNVFQLLISKEGIVNENPISLMSYDGTSGGSGAVRSTSPSLDLRKPVEISRQGQSELLPMEQEIPTQGGGGYPAAFHMDVGKEGEMPDEIPRYTQQISSISMDQGQIFNPWLAANVVGSPRLTRLIGALTLDCCEDIPDLNLPAPYLEDGEEIYDLIDPDQKACSSTVSKEVRIQRHSSKKTSPSFSFSISNLPTYILSMQHQSRMPSLLGELYPFPNSVPRRRLFSENLRTDYLMSTSSLERKELECRAKFKASKSMKPSAIIDLVNDMRSIAWRHYELEKYPESERWWRRVITSSLKVPGHDPFDILRACLWVIHCLCFQCRYKEALSLHHSIHSRIIKLVGLEHELAMFSRQTFGYILRLLGEHEREIEIFRELLQICLCRYGTRCRDTLDTIHFLGLALEAFGQNEEAATISCIYVQLDCLISPHTPRTLIDDESALQAMSTWATCLNRQQRYEDSTTVLNAAERRFKDLMRSEGSFYQWYSGEKAEMLGFEGQLFESEAILRTILAHPPRHPNLDIMNAMRQLADLLQGTGRDEEAVPLRERAFLDYIELYGVAHKYTIWDCETLGFCYAKLGRYDDAVHHFQQTIEILALTEDGDPASRDEYTQELHGWISEVEKMRRRQRC
jgi:tetratricopeptide (TPR) repeat protein